MPVEWNTILAVVSAGLAGVAAGAFGGLRQVIDAYMNRWRRSIDTPPLSGIQLLSRLADVHSLFTEAKSIPNVQRALVWVGHNCGGLPVPGAKYTVRAQIGWSDKDIDLVRRYSFDMEIDEEYARMLVDVHRDGYKVLEVEKMPPGLFKRIYRREKVVHAVLFALCHDKDSNSFGYASFASYEMSLTEDDMAGLGLVVGRLRQILNPPPTS